MSGSTGNTIGGNSQFGHMGSNDPYGSSDTTTPGGGGNHSSNNNAGSTPTQRQYSAILNDAAFMAKLTNLMKTAHGINPAAGFQITDITPGGSLTLSVTGLTSAQARQIGLGGLVMGYNAQGVPCAVGNIETGHTRPAYHSSGGSNGSSSGSPGMTAAQLEKSELGLFVKNFKEMTAGEETDALQKAGELIADMGEKMGAYLGDKYKEVAKEIAGEIRNFQGKTLRSFDDAMKSLNKITSNPGMKINPGDRDALVNAWQHVNAQEMANKLGNLSAAFKVADTIMKIEKVREKSIVGYQTGNWAPLMLEVESWVVSGMAAGVVISILSISAPVIAAAFGLPVSAITITGILVIGLLASLIDDSVVDKINNQLIPSAH